MKKVVAIAAFALVIFVATSALTVLRMRAWLVEPIAGLASPTTYEVPAGATLNAVLWDLQHRGFIEHPRAVSLWLRLENAAYRLKAGEYELRAGMTPRDVLELLSSGKVLLHSVTLIEGATFSDFQKILGASDVIRPSSPELKPVALLQQLGAHVMHPEGQFFPDTYRFPKGATDFEIYSLAFRRMQTELAQEWNDRDPALPLASPYEALILASIIEKETALGTERPRIAGLFIERLRKGMRLQTDPTVIYGLGSDYDGNIHKADLLHDTPYNTYTRAGLPPTPICMPGRDSLHAATHPEITGALYFVASGKGDGSHVFSKTLEEHNAAVQRFLRASRR